MISRRVLLSGGAVLGLAAAVRAMPSQSAPPAPGTFEVTHADADWHKLLTSDQYAVLRTSATERPYTSALLHEARKGEFACLGCDLPAFASTTKYDSRTGWPSFWAPIDKAVGATADTSFGMVRTAVHCSRCGSHLGHVFDDGPQPTGMRYCMNGIAMTFKPATA